MTPEQGQQIIAMMYSNSEQVQAIGAIQGHALVIQQCLMWTLLIVVFWLIVRRA